MMYVHRHLPLEGCWTVGFYSPDGEWEPVSDHDTEQAAAAEVVRMNGGPPPLPRPQQEARGMSIDDWTMDWRVTFGGQPGDEHFVIGDHLTGEVICESVPTRSPHDLPRRARFIAAAPDLLAAVEGFMRCRASDGTKCAPNDDDFERGAKALAKALGGA